MSTGSNSKGPTLSRRGFLAGTSATLAALGLGIRTLSKEDLEAAKAQGYKVKPVVCFQCSASCGLIALVKEGVPPDKGGVLLFANPHEDHPQRGMCGRAAAALHTWNSPLRLKKPMKRVGERGEGRFQEISWDQALDEIAAKLKEVVERHGPKAMAFTSHDLGPVLNWIAWPLGSPNVINHQSTCNTAGVVGRRWMMGRAQSHHAVVDPDYDNARFVVFVGRQVNAPMGIHYRLAKAKERGAKVVFINPVMPDTALTNDEWIPIKPGTDAALLLGIAHVLVKEGRVNLDFLARYTNLPFLLKPDGKPLTEEDLKEGGNPERFLLAQEGKLVFHDEAHGLPGDLEYRGEVRLANGETVAVEAAYLRFLRHLEAYDPERVASITGIPAKTIVRLARQLHVNGGVVEDTWYNTRNGNDTDAVMGTILVNALLGNIDQPGGLVFRTRARLPEPISLDTDTGEVKTVFGQTFTLEDTKGVDRKLHPDTNGTFNAVLEAILNDNPYPIRGLLVLGTTLFWRDMNTARLEEALKKLELLVVVDILHHEVVDWADYVLPAEMFLERGELMSVAWTPHAALAYGEPVLSPPPGADPRNDLWIVLEILRRAFPEKAALVGYNERFADYQTFLRDFAEHMDTLRLEGVAERWKRDPKELEAELKEKGFVILGKKKYGEIPYATPFETPSGRLEIYALRPVLKGYREQGFPEWFPPPAYTLPQKPDEFVLISVKSAKGSSGPAGPSFTSRYLVPQELHMNPLDAERLGIQDGDVVEVEGLDTGRKARVRVRLTRRVVPGAVFTYSYVAGHRTRKVKEDPRFAFLAEGINTQWFTTAYVDKKTGAGANNASVRIRKV